jgi:hypothetical protein
MLDTNAEDVETLNENMHGHRPFSLGAILTQYIASKPSHLHLLHRLAPRSELRIPIYSGRVFRREAGHRSDLKPAAIPINFRPGF